MNLKKAAFIILSILTLAAFSGCAKKPRRPNPIDTVSSMGNGNSGGSINPVKIGTEWGSGSASDIIEERSNDEPFWNYERGVLPEIYFDFNSASVKASERGKLAEVSDFLKSNPGSKLALEGHCDWRGTSEYNLALGDRRSKSVERYLNTLGISGDKMATISKGDLEATDGAASAQMAKERKVEILILK